MDITHLALCAGYDGIGLGLELAGIKPSFNIYVEIEAFACANLVSKIEEGKLGAGVVHTDVKRFPYRRFRGLVDILSAGFPCQPFSAAGQRQADSDPRHLWPHIRRGIEECQPSTVLLENVDGIVSARLGGDQWSDPRGTPVLLHVLRELERMGYRAEAGCFTASEVGAPHQRKRWFILGQLADSGHLPGCAEQWEQQKECPQELQGGNQLAHRTDCGWWQDWVSSQLRASVLEQSPGNCRDAEPRSAEQVWPSRPGEPQHDWEPPRVC